MSENANETGRPLSEVEETEKAKGHLANMITLEILFLTVIGIAVVAAFFEARTYQLVSSRTPFVIMVPLFALIVFHARRMWSVRGRSDFTHRLKLAATGQLANLNRTVVISIWMVVLLALITVLGHYAAILIFGFGLMRVVAKQGLKVSILVALGTTLMIYFIFEIGFNVELYRGLIWRYFAGYRDF
ncbi:tripartite tricarboxylate transporter TctB family protein [Roseibium marinum]|uniref:DUF1468 domain-containing protein n=1 Tax=Roseibium marinum TaxID=281252 RepID=A0A2S3V3K4_9HYPH|nr:tripartite tricarboxylate transporter TctB family protein [Roseibium marinum]POF34495.1 hypothetical protein CLV41_101951 [Roseibium marinum]